jgi:hypothetical protein
MSRGILIYAHNNETLDYVSLACASAKLATTHLGYPVTLVTDSTSISTTKSTYSKYFESVILVDKPHNQNKRIVNGSISSFLNSNRSSSWDITPYDHTLVIDADYFTFTDKLNNYWDIDQSFMIAGSANFFIDSLKGFLDRKTSSHGLPLKWATTLMFKKDQESKMVFDLVDSIKSNYHYFYSLYNFDSRLYRNDIAFTIACHILRGHLTGSDYELPAINTAYSHTSIISIDTDSKLKLVIQPNNPYIFSTSGVDLHFLNKGDLMQHLEKFL